MEGTFFWYIFIEFVPVLLLLGVLVFCSKACRSLAPPPSMEPAPPALKSKEELVHCQHLSLLFPYFPLSVVTPWLLRWGQKPGSFPLAHVPQ